MFHLKNILAQHVYKTGDAVDVSSGTWTASNRYNGEPSLYVIIRKDGTIIADAHMDADTVDGVRNIEFANPTCGHATRRKVSEMLTMWVAHNKPAVYPNR